MLLGFCRSGGPEGRQTLLIALLGLALLPLVKVQGQQINLPTQTKGVLPVTNGGTGIDVTSQSGCLFFTSGSPSILSPCGGSGVSLETNGTANSLQTLLDLVAGNGVALSNSGGVVTISQAPLFAITGFGASTAGTVELGATVPSPTNFTAGYTTTPVGAAVSDGTTSVTLTSPYTSGQLAKAYSLNSPGGVTFTLTAVGPTTQTATQAIYWAPRTFTGVGGAGATGAVASVSTATLSGATGTLSSAGLGATYAGQTFTLAPSGQKIYLLLTGAGHTFSVNGFGTVFSQTAVGFTNQFAVPVAMFLYESPATLTGTYAITVTQ